MFTVTKGTQTAKDNTSRLHQAASKQKSTALKGDTRVLGTSQMRF